MSTSVERAKQEALVTDAMGNTYVALHPNHAATPADYRRGLVGRLLVCAVSLLILLSSIAGQVAPYICFYAWNRTNYYTPWGFWVDAGGWQLESNVSYHPQTLTLCLVTSFVATLAFACAVALAVVYARQQRARQSEFAGSELALVEYGKRRANAAGDADHFVYTNERVENRGLVRVIPSEVHERRRLAIDRVLGAVTLLLNLLAGGCAIAALILMVLDYKALRRRAYVGSPTISAGIPLFAVAVGLSVVAVVLLLVPCVPRLRLCEVVRTVTPSELMLVEPGAVANPLLPAEDELRVVAPAVEPSVTTVVAPAPAHLLPLPAAGAAAPPPHGPLGRTTVPSIAGELRGV